MGADVPRRRRSVAVLLFAPLLLAMAAGQLSDPAAFARILADYRVFGDATPAVALAVPAVEALVAAGLLLPHRLAHGTRVAAGAGGLAVALFWSALAIQAFARGLALENCGCFGVHLGQELRWWILLEDAEFVLLAVLAARAVGLRATRFGRERGRGRGRAAGTRMIERASSQRSRRRRSTGAARRPPRAGARAS